MKVGEVRVIRRKGRLRRGSRTVAARVQRSKRGWQQEERVRCASPIFPSPAQFLKTCGWHLQFCSFLFPSFPLSSLFFPSPLFPSSPFPSTPFPWFLPSPPFPSPPLHLFLLSFLLSLCPFFLSFSLSLLLFYLPSVQLTPLLIKAPYKHSLHIIFCPTLVPHQLSSLSELSVLSLLLPFCYSVTVLISCFLTSYSAFFPESSFKSPFCFWSVWSLFWGPSFHFQCSLIHLILPTSCFWAACLVSAHSLEWSDLCLSTEVLSDI